jgi:dephospho-CoA kinase
LTRPFLRVALTGGIATGKSACLRRFEELGAPVIDADVVARHVVAPGTPGLDAIVKRFGRVVVRSDGALDRPALARVVFADARARRDLEDIVHPEVFGLIDRWFAEQRTRAADDVGDGTGPPACAIADVPLLYEAGAAGQFDRIVVAACHPQQQLERLMARDGLTLEEAQLRIRAQVPIDEKRARADFVIDTAGSLADTRAGVDRVWHALGS